MIANIIDCRKRIYRWKQITAIIEPAWHDNGCSDSDQALRESGIIWYEEQSSLSLTEAVAWATAKSESVTLYLYDEGKGINELDAIEMTG